MRAKFTFSIHTARARGKKGYRSRITHRNGEIVFNGGQLYSRKIDAIKVADNLIAAIKFGDFERLDNAHGRTSPKRPDGVDEPDAEVVDA